MLEGYTALGFLAGSHVDGQARPARHRRDLPPPGLLAKIVSTLDVLSGGRAVLGIGAGWYEREHRGLGVPFPPCGSGSSGWRRRCRSACRCGIGDNGPFEGRHYRLAETLCSPQPLSRPHPPIIIGGSGERKTLRLVAQYADACNLLRHTGQDRAQARRATPALQGSRARHDTIVKTTLYQGSLLLNGDVDGFVAEMADHAKLGIEMVIVMAVTDHPADWVEQTCAPASTRLARLPAA